MSKFWDKFSDLMAELPGYIEGELDKATKTKSGTVITRHTINGKTETTVIVDGVEYVRKVQ